MEAYIKSMKKLAAKQFNKQLPIFVEKGADGFYVVECPVLEGCYSQGKTLDEALRNIREVISMVLEEKKAQSAVRSFNSSEFSMHTLSV